MERRQLLGTLAAGTLGLGLASRLNASQAVTLAPEPHT